MKIVEYEFVKDNRKRGGQYNKNDKYQQKSSNAHEVKITPGTIEKNKTKQPDEKAPFERYSQQSTNCLLRVPSSANTDDTLSKWGRRDISEAEVKRIKLFLEYCRKNETRTSRRKT